MKLYSRLILSCIAFIAIQACDSAFNSDSSSKDLLFTDSSSLQLRAPSVLMKNRAVSVESLTVKVTLAYTLSNNVYSSTKIATYNDKPGDVRWLVALDVPTNVAFSLSMTWSEQDPDLDLIRIRREFEGFSNSGQVGFSYELNTTDDFSNVIEDPDYAGFDLDNDTRTNIDERLMGSDPFTHDVTQTINEDSIPLVAEPSSFTLRMDVNNQDTFVILLSNGNDAAIPFLAESDSAWLQLGTTSGEVGVGASQPLEVTIECDATATTLEGNINLLSIGLRSVVIPVQLQCAQLAAAALSGVSSALSLNAISDSAAQSDIALSNGGNASLTYNLQTFDNWINLQNTGGELAAGESTHVSVVANCEGALGRRTGEVSISSNGGNATVPLTLNCSAPPTAELSVVRDNLSFTAQASASISDSLKITNTGTAALTFNAQSDASWINVSPTSGTIEAGENFTTNITATCPSSSQSLSGTLEITSNGGYLALPLALNCTAVPTAQLGNVTSAISATIQSGTSTTKSISFANIGNAPLEYTITGHNANNWMTIESTTGVINSGDTTSTELLLQCGDVIGTLDADIIVNSGSGGTSSIPVNLICTRPPAPILSSVSTGLTLEAAADSSDSSALEFTNSGNASLSYRLSSNSSWIVLQDTSAEVEPRTTKRVNVTADCDGTVGQRIGVLVLTSNGGDAQVPLTLTCVALPEPEILVERSDFSFNAQTGSIISESFDISNPGNAPLTFSTQTNASWFSLSPNSGIVNAGTTLTAVATTACPSTPTTLTGTLSISSNAENISIPLSLTCTEAPTPQLANVTTSISTTIEINQTTSERIFLSNIGNAPLDFTVEGATPWMSIDMQEGSLARDENASIGLQLSCGSSEETLEGNILIESNGGSESVPISVMCNTPPAAQLSVVSTGLTIDTSVNEVTTISLDFENIGNAPLSYTWSSDAAWLSVMSPSGTVPPMSEASVSISASCSAQTNTRDGVLSISSNGGDRTINVSLTCRSATLSELSATEFQLAATLGQTDQATLTFANSGNDILDFTLQSNTNWLCIDESATADCLDGHDSLSDQVAAGSTYTLYIATQCPSTTGSLNGNLTLTGNIEPIVIPVTLACTSSEPIITNPSISYIQAKTFRFNWTDSQGAEYYQLLERADPSSDFTVVSQNISRGVESFDHVVGLHLKNQAVYKLRTCYAAGCVDSNEMPVTGNLVNAIGHISGPARSGFGKSMDLSGDGNTMVVFQSQAGSIDIYKLSASATNGVSWSLNNTIDIDTALGTNTFSSYSVSINHDGSVFAVGLPNAFTNDCVCISGRVRVYSQTPLVFDVASTAQNAVADEWFLNAEITSEQASPGDEFGFSVDLDKSGTHLFIASPGADAVYEFQKTDAGWIEGTQFSPIDRTEDVFYSQEFGSAIQATPDHNVLVISFDFHEGSIEFNGKNITETVRVYRRNNNTQWIYEGLLFAAGKAYVYYNDERDFFGSALSISDDGNTIAIGAPDESSNASGINGPETDDSLGQSGATYIFTRNSGRWSQQAYIKASKPNFMDAFGNSVSLTADGNQLAVGARQEASTDLGFGADETADMQLGIGAGYLYTRSGNLWQQSSYFKASKATLNLGESIVISPGGENLFISSSNANEIYYY